MLFKKVLRKRIITKVSEVNNLIKLIKTHELKVIKCGIDGDYLKLKDAEKAFNKDMDLTRCMYIVQKDTRLEISTKWVDTLPTTYIFSLDGKPVEEKSGQQCFMEMSRYYKLPKILNEPFYKADIDPITGKYTLSASPIIGYNKKYDKTELHDCYEYDLNSAYSSIILAGIPDLWHPSEIKFAGVKVGRNQIGFIFDEQLSLVEPGGIADIKFNMIPCPEGLKKFIMKYYEIKKNSKGAEKQKAKDMLNIPIGYSQRCNPFFRAYVIHRCNERIEKLIDDKTLFWNTDAIFTLNKRDDIVIGEEIGDFKEIKINKLRYNENNYQIDDEIPVYRGIPKVWVERWQKKHGKVYNIITDEPPVRDNIYKFDMKTLKLEVNK